MSTLSIEFAALPSWLRSAHPGTGEGPVRELPHGRVHGLLMLAVPALLDELDYGVVLLGETNRVLHANRAAQSALHARSSLEVAEGRLRASHAGDAAALAEGLAAAAQRGLRRFVTLGAEDSRIAVALIPLGPLGSTLAQASLPAQPPPGLQGSHGPHGPHGSHGSDGSHGPLTLLVIGRRHLCERLSVQCFARAHRLTPAESNVLELLCEGLDPREIATLNGVGIATVRTQVNRIREKTGAASIRRLIGQVATLPPMLSALRG
jgi:DNA-binding CsgD family transcriptional regulator